MPMLHPRSPDAYPVYILRAVDVMAHKVLVMDKPEHDLRMGPTWATKADVLREQRRFLAFKTHVPLYPLHRANEAIAKLDFRCTICRDDHGFYLSLRARRKSKAMADIKSILAG